MLHLIALSLALAAPVQEYDVVLLDTGGAPEPFTPTRIAADGVILGSVGEGSTSQPWRWTREHGAQPFPILIGWPFGVALDRNRFGDTVGQLRNHQGEARAVVWVEDAPMFVEDLVTSGPDLSLTSANEINDAGTLAGRFDSVQWGNGLVWFLEGAELSRIYAPGTLWPFFLGGMGEDGVLVGTASFPESYACTVDGDELTLLDHPDFQGPFSFALDRNESGLVVGAGMFDPNPFTNQATVWSPDGQPRNLDPDFVHGESWIRAINSEGVMVGNRKPKVGHTTPSAAAVISAGQDLVDLNTRIDPDSGWQLEVAVDVSDAGWIVGTGSVRGEPAGFLLIPR